jgi:hypothetical protein
MESTKVLKAAAAGAESLPARIGSIITAYISDEPNVFDYEPTG